MAQVLKVLQIAIVVVVGVGVALATWLLSLMGETPWPAALTAVIGYVSIISLVLFKESDAWMLKLAGILWHVLLGGVRPAVATLSSAVILCGALAYGIHSGYQAPTVLVQVYEGSAAAGKFQIGAEVRLRNIETGEELGPETISETGTVYFNPKSGFYNALIRLQRDGKLKELRVPLDELSSLPSRRTRINIAIAQYKPDDWEPVPEDRLPPQLAVETFARLDVTAPQRPQRKIGSGAFDHGNAPFGVPGAKVLVSREAYLMGYDPALKIPRWVSYVVQPNKDRHRYLRRVPPELDPDLERTQQAHPKDYRRSGYDRGNLIARADVMFRSKSVFREANYLSTVAPQTPVLNRVVWLKLEKAGRKLAAEHGEIVVMAGTVFSGDPGAGDRKGGKFVVIGKNRVAVPNAFFRVMLVRPRNERPRVYAFIVPNHVSKDADPASFAVTVRDVEARTGLDLMPGLDLEVHVPTTGELARLFDDI